MGKQLNCRKINTVLINVIEPPGISEVCSTTHGVRCHCCRHRRTPNDAHTGPRVSIAKSPEIMKTISKTKFLLGVCVPKSPSNHRHTCWGNKFNSSLRSHFPVFSLASLSYRLAPKSAAHSTICQPHSKHKATAAPAKQNNSKNSHLRCHFVWVNAQLVEKYRIRAIKT